MSDHSHTGSVPRAGAAPEQPPALRALGPGEPPRYAGLRRDERGIVAGAWGLVAVRGEHRLAALLAALSHAIDLARGITVERHAGLALVTLAPPDDGTLPSQLLDTVRGALAAARLSAARARLFTGDGQVFVPYADPAAPHGYDAGGPPPACGRALLQPNQLQLLPEPRPAPLLDALLQAPLQPAATARPATLAVLTDRRLAALVAGYVQRHGLAYAVRFLSWSPRDQPGPFQRTSADMSEDVSGREIRFGFAQRRPLQPSPRAGVALFDIVSAAAVQPVPGFVCDFLRRLPRTTLLSDALEPADLEQEPARRVLLAWDRRAPLALPHIRELLPPRAILVLAEAPWGAALIESPPPRTAMQQLSEVALAAPARATLGAQPAGRLRLQLELLPGGPAHGPVHALLLDAAAIRRLRRMVRHLPAPLFASARIALGDDVALLVAPEDGELAGLPLGRPLARAEPPELLLPRGMRLLPALPQDLLAPALGLEPATLTVLTPACRYDVPLAALQPLASLLALDAPARSQPIAVRPVALPPLDLDGLEETPAPPPPAVAPPARAEKEQRGLLDRLRGPRPADGAATAPFAAELRRRAAELEQQGAYELAAAFYTYLKDEQRAAACYRRLAQGGAS